MQVYLIEMKRVTVALTQMLARALRNRAGNFLLVLTADYERLVVSYDSDNYYCDHLVTCVVYYESMASTCVD